jgi:hypothetical protein
MLVYNIYMTTQQSPATPSNEATPGNAATDINNNQPAPGGTTPPADQGGQVSITTEELRRLQRQDARARSFDRRTSIGRAKLPPVNNKQDSDPDSELANELNAERTLRLDAERKVMQTEVRLRVRDVLDKPEFKDLPQSTKNIILRNPAALTQSDNIEEALLDIEDFCFEQIDLNGSTKNTTTEAKPDPAPQTRVTPPPHGGGQSTTTSAEGDEDVSKLSGPARSSAMIRNSLKRSKGYTQN